MTVLAAFDGSELAAAALSRAAEYADLTEQRLVVVSVLPTNGELASEYDFGDDPYDPETAAVELRETVREHAADAVFRAESVEAYAGRRRIARKIRQTARQVEADVVFVGSDDAGRVVRPVSSVAGAVADTDAYDVFIVRSD
ncbi:MAG: universal stress protein [Natronomonas sp.]